MKINYIYNIRKRNIINLTQNANTADNLTMMNLPIKNSINVKKIVTVYQLNYKNGTFYGLGDFIRGCFWLISLCEKLGLKFDIDFSNHPLSKYVKGHCKNLEINYDDIYKMSLTDKDIQSYSNTPDLFCKKFKYLLQNVKSDVYYTASNLDPVFAIKKTYIEFIKSRIMPNAEMMGKIEREMKNLNLINSNFSVIHIRAGDKFLSDNNNKLQENIVRNLFDKLKVLLNNESRKYLILSDFTNVKMLFNQYDNCVFQINKITHLGENLIIEEDAVQNTMMDFYLMSRSSHIYSYALMYKNCSGFSKWCSVVYNIPYEWYEIQ